MAVRVALAEPDFLLMGALETLTQAAPGLELAWVARDADELREGLLAEIPDVVVCDLSLPPPETGGGIEIARELRTTHPDVGFVVLSDSRDPQYLLELLEGGSQGRGYLLRDCVRSGPQLASAIEAVGCGGSVVDPTVVQLLLHRRANEHTRLEMLTRLEHDIIVRMATGASNVAIADSTGMAKRTVEKHVGSIFTKLELPVTPDVSRRVQAVLRFLGEERAATPISR